MRRIRGDSSVTSSHHLNFWQFIDCIKEEQYINELGIEQYLCDNHQIGKNIAMVINKVENFWDPRMEVIDINDFLKYIAHNTEHLSYLRSILFIKYFLD